MKQEHLEIDEALQAELVRRVMALEGREETLRLSNLQLENTIEALTECTKVSPVEIRRVAEDLARNSIITSGGTNQAGGYTQAAMLKPKTAGTGLAALACLFLVVKFFSPGTASSQLNVSPSPPSVLQSAIGSGGLFHKKAMLASAMADMSTVKIMVLMHYHETGEYPESISDLGLDPETMVSRNVRGMQLERGGVIVADLPKKLGGDIQLKLVPSEVMGGTSVEWSCYSNLPASVLSGTPCEQS